MLNVMVLSTTIVCFTLVLKVSYIVNGVDTVSQFDDWDHFLVEVRCRSFDGVGIEYTPPPKRRVTTRNRLMLLYFVRARIFIVLHFSY